jgi:hypothetical protein
LISPGAAQPLAKEIQSQRWVIRLRSLSGKGRHSIKVVGQVNLTHVFRVVVTQFVAVRQPEHQRISHPVAAERFAVAQPPGQHGINDQSRAVVEAQQQELAAPLYCGEGATGEAIRHLAAHQVARQPAAGCTSVETIVTRPGVAPKLARDFQGREAQALRTTIRTGAVPKDRIVMLTPKADLCLCWRPGEGEQSKEALSILHILHRIEDPCSLRSAGDPL